MSDYTSHRNSMSERECYLMAVEHLRGLRDSLRGLAQLRKDAAWLLPVRILEQIEDKIKVLMNGGGRAPLLLLPEYYRRND
jgi:hypothetical protein